MNKIILFLLLTFFMLKVEAQKGSHGGGSGASVPQSASSTSNSQTGYVYRLKRHFHISYKAQFGSHIDSNSRYWDNNEYHPNCFLRKAISPIIKWVFIKHRLKVLIMQDSSILHVSIYREFLPPYVKKTDVRSIRNGSNTVIDTAYSIGFMDSIQNFYFRILSRVRAGDPLYFISLHYGITQYGALTIPFKYRWAPHTISKTSMGNTSFPTPSESSGSINVAAFICRKWGRTRFYSDPSLTHNTVSYMLGAFIGPQLISMSSNNVDSSVNLNTSPSQILALSFGPSATIEWRNIDFGISGGWDVPFSKNTGWVYGRKFWLGFGIGINLGMFTSGTSQFQ